MAKRNDCYRCGGKLIGPNNEDSHTNYETCIKNLQAKVANLENERSLLTGPDWGDKPLPEDEQINAAFPTRSGRHRCYAEAMRLVGARRSKFALVELVNWLLVRIADLEDVVVKNAALMERAADAIAKK